MNKKVTFSDIAKYTNVSKMTVSRYFNDPGSLTPETKGKIEKALKELNYKSNKVAKILANGRSEFIGIIIPELFFDYYSQVLNEILTTYNDFNYKFLVFAGNHDQELEKKYIEELLAYQVEGLIILSYTLPSEVLKEYNIPIVTIEREDQYVTSINTNNYLGAQLAAEHLIQDQCDILININSFVRENVPAYDRIRGFEDTCRQNQIPCKIIQKNFKNDYDVTYELLDSVYRHLESEYSNKRKGVFLSNDNYANIFLNILIKNKKQIPEEYEIIGFDNTISKESIIPITTVAQNIQKIARSAVEELKEQIESKDSEKKSEIRHVIIDPQLIIRGTTGRNSYTAE
ncbi:LacI family DNA-binding transcriptional regulator [Anaerostipes butyraticus]|uniref:LacI family DNA-binding transcriptional regulator n=1 Tax=Anaerostipes butyraticus TaxID=645466 RepID=UPI0023A7FEDF|nr:LacI family DNA-binding transcriptional regulator [Anaerostipes butyraticus]